VEKDSGEAGNDPPRDDIFVERRTALARQYASLPAYGSAHFWSLLEECREESHTPPLEVLVKVLREEALVREDKQAQRRLFAVIVARLQPSNELWVNQAISKLHLLAGERRAFAADLYADLCEHLLRAFIDSEQHFWEESFHHALRFARKHTYESFLRREGHWQKVTPGPGFRVPQRLLESLERAEWQTQFVQVWELPDEHAELAFLNVEHADLLFRLPTQLRAIVWLTFWEDCTTKTVGELLGISDRTVRNRLRAALAQLRRIVVEDQEVIDGASA